MEKFKPMLSAVCTDVNTLRYPVLASHKLDGIRAIVKDGKLLSRTLKPIPNLSIGQMLEDPLLEGLEGELILRPQYDGNNSFSKIQSIVMSKKDEANSHQIQFLIFDDTTNPSMQFIDRYRSYRQKVLTYKERNYGENALVVGAVRQDEIFSPEELEEYIKNTYDMGFEGVMIRDPYKSYKYGRSTLKEQGMVKIKKWFDSEAIVQEVIDEQNHHQQAGSLTVYDWRLNKTFHVGSGLSEIDRQWFWINRDSKTVIKYKYQELTDKGVPRFPIFLSIVDPETLDFSFDGEGG